MARVNIEDEKQKIQGKYTIYRNIDELFISVICEDLIGEECDDDHDEQDSEGDDMLHVASLPLHVSSRCS